MEVLVVLGVLAVLLAVALPFTRSFKFGADLGSAADGLLTTLREAQSLAMAEQGATPYGVYFNTTPTPPQYILYQGSSYLSRDTSFNTGGYGEARLPIGVAMTFSWTGSPPTELTFAQLTGKVTFPSSTDAKTITLALPNVGTRTITVTAEGVMWVQ